jgi:hypothetical protein
MNEKSCPIETEEPADGYVVWFRERIDEQADAVYENIGTLKRAKELAEKHVGAGTFRMGQVIGYRNGEEVYEKIVGHIDGKLTWVDPW